jgi:hypothetical protein
VDVCCSLQIDGTTPKPVLDNEASEGHLGLRIE